MIAALAALAAHAQEAAHQVPVDVMPGGTLGDYTGPAGLVGILVLTLDRFGLLRGSPRNDTMSAAAEISTIKRLAILQERCEGMRRDIDATRDICTAIQNECRTAIDQHRDATAQRLDRLHADVRRELDR